MGTEPSYTEQIEIANIKIQALQSGMTEAKKTLNNYQERLDKAEELLTEALVADKVEGSKKSAERLSDLRVERNSIQESYRQAQEDIKMLPLAQKELATTIRRLRSEQLSAKANLVKKVIKPEVEKADKAAMRALAKCAALHVIVVGGMGYFSAENLTNTLIGNKEFREMLSSETDKLINKHGLDKL
jgi:chromosome segregation ATPase